MAIMDLFTSLQTIVNERFAKNVRQAIHDGIYRANQVADENKDLVDQVVIRQDAVEQYNNQMIIEMTDKDVISAPELIESRDGEVKLSARLARDKNELTNRVTHIMLDNAISPDSYTGTDAERVQQAIDDAIEEKRAIKFARVYDINGSTILINKHNGDGTDMAGARERNPLYFLGAGGGLKKEDSGFFFSSNYELVGDLHFVSMKFYGVANAGACIFDGDAFIRVFWNGSTSRYVDGFAWAKDVYLQSWHLNGGSIIGGEGWAIETPGGFDVSMSGGFFVEHRQHFFRQTELFGGTFSKLGGFRLHNIMVEGIRGTAFYFKSVEGLSIDGLYLESNKNTDIEFDPTGNFEGVRIENVRVYEAPDTDKTCVIKWGGRLHSASTANVNGKNVTIHDTTNVTLGDIISDNDRSSDAGYNALPDIDPDRRIKKTSSRLVTKTTGAVTSSELGIASRYTYVSPEAVLVPSKGIAYVEVQFPREVYRDDVVSGQIYTQGSNYHNCGIVNTVRKSADRRNVVFTIYNFGDSSSNILIYATLISYMSYTG